jgi:hypothetical protein
MVSNIADEIQKQYGEVDFFDPIISYRNNEIQFESKLNFIEGLYVFVGFGAILFSLFIVHIFWFAILIAISEVFYIYELITSGNIVMINFEKNEIQISNPIFLFNGLRKIFKRPTSIPFNEIHSFKNYRRKGNWIKPRPNILVAKSFNRSPIKIAKFRFEKDSLIMAELLNEFIVGKMKNSSRESNVLN